MSRGAEAVLSLLLLILAAFLCAGTEIMVDDWATVVVYARNFISSGSFYYNAGEGAVDGFTSLLDVLVKAAALRFFPEAPFRVVWLLSLGYLLLVLLLAFHLVGKATDDIAPTPISGVVFFGMLTLVVFRPITIEFGFFLETFLYIAAVFWLALVFLRCVQSRTPVALVIFPALVVLLTRPEGLGLAAVGLAMFALLLPNGYSARQRWGPLLTYVPLALLYIAWRCYYFGYWAPNTYYAKRSANLFFELQDGYRYLYYAFANPAIALTLVAAGAPVAAFILRRESPRNSAERLLLFLSGIAAAATFATLVGGGDCWPGIRFLLLPAVIGIVNLILLAKLLKRRMRLLPLVLLALIAGNSLYAHGRDGRLKLGEQIERMANARLETIPQLQCIWNFGEKLASVNPKFRVAHTDFQMIKLAGANLNVLDLSGLNSQHIAHTPDRRRVLWGKMRFASIFEELPEVVFPGVIVRPRRLDMSEFSVEDLFRQRNLLQNFVYSIYQERVRRIATQLSQHYTSASIEIQPCPDRPFALLLRKDTVNQFTEAGFTVREAR